MDALELLVNRRSVTSGGTCASGVSSWRTFCVLVRAPITAHFSRGTLLLKVKAASASVSCWSRGRLPPSG